MPVSSTMIVVHDVSLTRAFEIQALYPVCWFRALVQTVKDGGAFHLMMQMSAALIMSWSSIVTWPTNADTRAESVLPFQVIMYVERHDNALGVCVCVCARARFCVSPVDRLCSTGMECRYQHNTTVPRPGNQNQFVVLTDTVTGLINNSPIFIPRMFSQAFRT